MAKAIRTTALDVGGLTPESTVEAVTQVTSGGHPRAVRDGAAGPGQLLVLAEPAVVVPVGRTIMFQSVKEDLPV